MFSRRGLLTFDIELYPPTTAGFQKYSSDFRFSYQIIAPLGFLDKFLWPAKQHPLPGQLIDLPLKVTKAKLWGETVKESSDCHKSTNITGKILYEIFTDRGLSMTWCESVTVTLSTYQNAGFINFFWFPIFHISANYWVRLDLKFFTDKSPYRNKQTDVQLILSLCSFAQGNWPLNPVNFNISPHLVCINIPVLISYLPTKLHPHWTFLPENTG